MSEDGVWADPNCRDCEGVGWKVCEGQSEPTRCHSLHKLDHDLWPGRWHLHLTFERISGIEFLLVCPRTEAECLEILREAGMSEEQVRNSDYPGLVLNAAGLTVNESELKAIEQWMREATKNSYYHTERYRLNGTRAWAPGAWGYCDTLAGMCCRLDELVPIGAWKKLALPFDVRAYIIINEDEEAREHADRLLAMDKYMFKRAGREMGGGSIDTDDD